VVSGAAVTGACLAVAAMTCGDELGGSTLSEATPMLQVEQGEDLQRDWARICVRWAMARSSRDAASGERQRPRAVGRLDARQQRAQYIGCTPPHVRVSAANEGVRATSQHGALLTRDMYAF
jgi:hypothetical protein